MTDATERIVLSPRLDWRFVVIAAVVGVVVGAIIAKSIVIEETPNA